MGVKIATAAVALALAACGPGESGNIRSADNAAERHPRVQDATAEAIQPVDDASAPASAPDSRNGGEDEPMAWNFDRTAAGPKLAFGEPETDNVELVLRCPPGGNSVILSFLRASDLVRARPDSLTVAAGGDRRTVEVERQESELGGTSVQAVLPISAAPIQRFGAGSSLAVTWGDETISVPSAGATAGEFLRVCGPT